MAVVELAPKTEFIPLESNWYLLTLLSYEIRDREADQYHKKPFQDVQFQWSVTVPGGDAVERRSWANIPAAFNEKSAFCLIGMALGAIDPGAGDEPLRVDLDEWLGLSCRGNIVEITKKDGTLGDKIQDYAALRRPGTKAAPARPAPKPQPPTLVDGDDSDPMPF